jgi:hypothetical protein
MAEDAQHHGNGNPSGGAESTAAGATQEPAEGNGASRVGRGVKAALVAAAVGTAVAAAARSRGSSAESGEGSTGTDSQPAEARSSRARGAMRRSEPVVHAAWDAAKGSLEPGARNGARQAGRFVADRSPDFVRDNVIPPFVEGLTEARGE